MIESHKKTIVAFFVFIMLFAIDLVNVAQNSTNSPYTRFGYGQLSNEGFSRSQGMGGIGYGLRSNQTINPANPASYSDIDSTSFMFAFGVSIIGSRFSSDGNSASMLNGNLDYLAMEFPITKWMGLSAGLTPYSMVGYNYNFKDSLIVPGDTSYSKYTQTFAGSGGINQAYLGFSIDFFKHLSLGLNAYYMYGSISHARDLSWSGVGKVSTTQADVLYVKNFNYRLGLQYHTSIGASDNMTLGMIFENKTPLNSSLTVTTIGNDTVTQHYTNSFDLPTVFGGGFTYTHNNKLTIGADYCFQGYSNARYYGVLDSLKNYSKFAAGFEYTKNPRGNKYFDRVKWRGGVNYTNSYIILNDKRIPRYALDFGMGLPLKTSQTYLNFYLEYSLNGHAQATGLQEQYIKLGLNVSFNEHWFEKRQLR